MPESRIVRALEQVSRRLRLRAALGGLAAGGAAFAALFVLTSSPLLAAAAAIVIAIVIGIDKPSGLSKAALAVEQAAGSMDNLVVTAAQLIDHPSPTRAEIRGEILRQAEQRLASADLSHAVPLTQPLVVTMAVLFGCVLVMFAQLSSTREQRGGLPAGSPATTTGIDSLIVRITPPAYTRRSVETVENPVQIAVLAGSHVRIDVRSLAPAVVAESVAAPVMAFHRQQQPDVFAAEFVASRSIGLAVRPQSGRAADARFLSILVTPDAPPSVRVRAPGRDMAMPGPSGQIALEVESADDLGLASLALKFTKASGGGEALTFTQGEVPLAVSRLDDRRWTATGRWVLDGLDLSDGDVLVYSAVARDRNPSGAPVQSEQYLVEIGRTSQSVSAGFGLPAEEKKYAISQQMVIYKTEQLLASRATLSADARLEQARMIAIEQRMVRAEVVFLGGGEVQDEVEEAAQSDELAEGRLQNTGRAEMLRAINFMSRAEAQLNGGEVAAALVFERQALRSLELAFDRRRYFLRTLSDRSRIDTSRRLTGKLDDARSWTKDLPPAPSSVALEALRSVMRDLAEAMAVAGRGDAALAARVASIDPASTELQQAAVQLAAAATPNAFRIAAERAMQIVATHARTLLAAPAEPRLTADPLSGRLADELRRVPR